MSDNTRLRSLDGLRGLAALVVVVHHAALTFSPLAAAYFGAPVEGRLARFLVYTPAHLLWAGGEAVLVFFVISGYALAWAARSPRFDWGSYYPARMVRLYGPVLGAIVLAWVTFKLFPRSGGHSLWLEHGQHQYNVSMMVRDAVLLDGYSGGVTPLWSLKWEVLFSLSLPVFVYFATRLRAEFVVVAAIALSTAGEYLALQSLMYLPMFALGVAVAARGDALNARIVRTGRTRISEVAWTAALVVSALLLTNRWWLPSVGSNPWGAAGEHSLVLVGALGVVLTAIGCRWWRSVLEGRVFAWLGALSFSLYLVHEPIIKAAAFTFPGSVTAQVGAIAIALGIAVLFLKVVERPIHRVARRIASRPVASPV